MLQIGFNQIEQFIFTILNSDIYNKMHKLRILFINMIGWNQDHLLLI